MEYYLFNKSPFKTALVSELLDGLNFKTAGAKEAQLFLTFYPASLLGKSWDDYLRAANPTATVECSFHSCRNWYEHMAVDMVMTPEAAPTVAEFVIALNRCMGGFMDGYKGGTYLMEPTCPIWIAPYGRSTSIVIAGTSFVGGRAFIHAAYVDLSSY